MSEDGEEVLGSDDESGQENVTPNDDAVARAMAEEEAMIEMTEDCPYQAILELMNVIADSQFAAEAARFVMRGTGIPKRFRLWHFLAL